MQYIGLDVHARHFSIAVVGPTGQLLFAKTLPTSEQNLRQAVEAVARPHCVVLEESTIAAWAFRVLDDDRRQVIVADPTQNRWIGKDEKLDDETAAYKLATLLRTGTIKPVHQTDLERHCFKELVLLYHDIARDITRAKNRLKAKFRQHGIDTTGAGIYTPDRREEWLEKLPSQVRLCAETLFRSVTHHQEQRKLVLRELRRASRSYEPIGRFQELPGLGLVRAATIYAIIDTPHRFATRAKLWSYCGLGIARRSSDRWSGPEHLTRQGNRLLKAQLKGAAKTAVSRGANRYASQYERLVAQGTSPGNAMTTVARSMATTLWVMWKSAQAYDPSRKPCDRFAPHRPAKEAPRASGPPPPRSSQPA